MNHNSLWALALLLLFTSALGTAQAQTDDHIGSPPALTAPTDESREITSQDFKRLEHLETAYFFKQYPQNSVAARLKRLEKFIFGQASKGDVESRLTILEQALAEKDPRTGKLLAPDIVKTMDQGPPPAPAKTAVTAPPQTVPQAGATGLSVADQNSDQLIYPDAIASAPPKAPPPPPSLDLSLKYFAIQDTPQMIIKEVTSAMNVDPKQADFSFQRAKAFMQLGKLENAIADLNNAIETMPSNPDYYLARAYVYFKQGNKILASQDLKSARFYDSKLPPVIYFDGLRL